MSGPRGLQGSRKQVVTPALGVCTKQQQQHGEVMACRMAHGLWAEVGKEGFRTRTRTVRETLETDTVKMIDSEEGEAGGLRNKKKIVKVFVTHKSGEPGRNGSLMTAESDCHSSGKHTQRGEKSSDCVYHWLSESP